MTIRTVLMAATATLALASPTLAAGGLYVGGGLGYQSPSDGDFHAPALSQIGKYSYKSTNTFLLDTGYKFSSGLRLELEGQYGQFDGDELKISVPAIAKSSLHGHISQATVYLNANYDFPLVLGWTATVGGGVGSAWTDSSGSAFSGFTALHGSDHAFAWQVGGGIVHRVLPNLDLQVDYRYQGTGDVTVHNASSGDVHFGNIKAQTVTLTARLYLNPF